MVAPRTAPLPRSRPVAGDGGRRRIEHWRVFGPGPWNGGPDEDGKRQWTAENMRELAANWKRFQRPINSPHPFYRPFISINHNDRTSEFARGRVIECGTDPDGWFWVTFDVDAPIAEALDNGQLPAASVEWWNTRLKKHRIYSGFPPNQDGSPAGLILRAVTLCGSMAQAVKGQPPPPKSKPVPGDDWIQRFDNAAPPGRLLVEIPNVDELIQKIMAAAPGLTPEQAQAIAMAVGPNGDDTPPPEAPPADGAGMDDAAGLDMASMTPAEKQMFRDLSAIKKKVASIEAKENAAKVAESDSLIQKFHDAVLFEKKATPAEAKKILDELKSLPVGLRESSVNTLSKHYRVAGLNAPPAADRQFNDGSPSRTGATGEPDIQTRILASSLIGRQILAEKAKAAAPNN